MEWVNFHPAFGKEERGLEPRLPLATTAVVESGGDWVITTDRFSQYRSTNNLDVAIVQMFGEPHLELEWNSQVIARTPDRFISTIIVNGHKGANLNLSVTEDVQQDFTVKGSKFKDVIVILGPGNHFVKAGSGNDYVETGDGRDNLQGNGGHDTLKPGCGVDIVSGAGGKDTLIITVGIDKNRTPSRFDTIVDVPDCAQGPVIPPNTGGTLLVGPAQFVTNPQAPVGSQPEGILNDLRLFTSSQSTTIVGVLVRSNDGSGGTRPHGAISSPGVDNAQHEPGTSYVDNGDGTGVIMFTTPQFVPASSVVTTQTRTHFTGNGLPVDYDVLGFLLSNLTGVSAENRVDINWL